MSRRRRPAPAPAGFWGSAEVASAPAAPIRPTDDPTAVVASLGPPPLAGQEVPASHYFAAVYGKAVGGASALAAAAGLLDLDDGEGGDGGEGGDSG